ncbi:DUF1833 domain-containing protein [Pseudomonas sp. TMW22090]|uniref:DUF1833 family protein n=1 Tax=Pseudomonas sp. TMW22090 TaxID=2506434 RepID=UPI001F0EEEA3|nr:DUF1833 family protein [Pseudomonas sp. TMW22090]MCH4880167.1 DUF1833 domain-containing protein [Pseudomonas sp. TMW22090]
MSNPIAICYASAGSDMIINSIEAMCSIWPESIRFCAGYDDYVLGTEDGRAVLFTAMGFEEALPSRDNSAFQNILIGLDNTNGLVQQKLEEARAAEARVTIAYRRYLESDLSYPQERYHMSLLNRQYEGNTATLTCGVFDLLGTEYPRRKLTAAIAPGIIYI